MGSFKISPDDVYKFIEQEKVLYASGDGKKFFIPLQGDHSLRRYVVEIKQNPPKKFSSLLEAVYYFNNN